MMCEVGWGKQSDSDVEDRSNVLLEVRVPVVNNKKCNAAMWTDITDGMICAGGVEGKDTCKV